jgi:hypothetical protein
MYIYDPKSLGAQPPLKEQPINGAPALLNSYSTNRGVSGFGQLVGSGGSYGWANEGLGEPVPQQSKGTEAKDRALRELLNKWRALKGETPITETGPLGPETKKAILQFQKDSGLKREDGIADAPTLERLTLLLDIQRIVPVAGFRPLMFVELVGRPGFRSMEGATQTEVLRRILFYGKVGTLDRIWHLTELVHKFAFNPNQASSQKLMLRILAARPDDEHLASALGSLAESFTNVEGTTQIWVLKRIESYAGNRRKIDNLKSLISFSDPLSKESRSVMLVAHANHPNDAALINNFRRAIQDPDFRLLDQQTQTEVLNRIVNYPRDIHHGDNLMSLVTTPGFGKLGATVRAEILDGLPSRFGKIFFWQNNASLTNMMTLVTALGFEKLRPEVRALMLDLQAARHDNAQLANALGNLAFGPKLHDRRIAIQTILQVNDSIP